MASARPGSDPRLAALLPAFARSVRIGWGEVPVALPVPLAKGVLWQADARRLLLEIPDTARVLVSHDAILVTPLDEGGFARLGPMLRRTPLAAVQFLRGAMACHGAAVAGPGGAIVILGQSAMGKSSLAAALMQRGCRLLADDLTSIVLNAEGQPVVQPVWPELVLWPDILERLFPEGAPSWLLPQPRDYFGTPYWGIAPDLFSERPARVQAIYRLTPDRIATSVAMEPITGMARLQPENMMHYNSRIAEALMDRAGLLQIFSAVAAAAPMFDVKLPQTGVDEMKSLADRIAAESR